MFSDKTGTLTCNVMELRSCIIAGTYFTDEKKNRSDPIETDLKPILTTVLETPSTFPTLRGFASKKELGF